MIVYSIKNKTNGKEYIGLTTRELDVRWKQHIYESNKDGSWEYKTPLGLAIKKYGAENFTVSILERYETVDSMKVGETDHIKQRNSHVSCGGYNVTMGGDGRIGAKHSDETRAKISMSNRGKIISSETRQKMSASKQGEYELGNHPKAMAVLINETERFDSLKEFVNKYGLKYSSVVSSLSRNNGKTSFKNFLIERLYG
jgi:group I intron endonuclease